MRLPKTTDAPRAHYGTVESPRCYVGHRHEDSQVTCPVGCIHRYLILTDERDCIVPFNLMAVVEKDTAPAMAIDIFWATQ